MSSWELALVLAGIMFGATVVGLVAGRSLSRQAETLREPLGTAVVNDANAIGTSYLRAQTLREPVRSLSLPLYAQYTDPSIRLSKSVPGHRWCDSGEAARTLRWPGTAHALRRLLVDTA